MIDSPKLFSQELEEWLNSDKPKTVKGISDVFAEKSFAVVFLVFMSLPALPIPTGGITHVLELIVMLVAIELIVGHKAIWVPKKWRNKSVGKTIEKKIAPFILKRLRWFEKYSNQSRHQLLTNKVFRRVAGVAVLVFSLTAFIAPPFSGLDTIPSLGAVVIAIALLFNDIRLFVLGCLMGLTGMAIVIVLFKTVIMLWSKLFNAL
jgi:hypothetical protein